MPPTTPDSHAESLDPDIERLSDGMLGVMVVGDLNIHQRR